MGDLKVAIMNHGCLITYRCPRELLDEIGRGHGRRLTISLAVDETGAVADGKSRPTVKDLADYFGLPHEPKRTITESGIETISDRTGVSPWAIKAVARELDHDVVPNPEPTNAERWERFCSDLDIDLEPWQINYLSEVMDERGVTAPGGDDDH